MGITSRGFTTFDPTVDKSKQMNDYITKDSKENMELLDTQLTTLDNSIKNKVKLNNESIQTVNFIRNDVVQDSLVDINTVFNDSIQNNYTLITRLKLNSYSANRLISRVDTTNLLGWEFSNSSAGVLRVYVYKNKSQITYDKSITTPKDYINVLIAVKNNKLTVRVNDIVLCSDAEFDLGLISNAIIFNSAAVISVEHSHLYNRILTPQEIQHSFSILNNSPSINRINDYAISTDTDHIEDSGSILQSKINRVFYKNMCKEFTSNGEPIVVNNGMDGYVLSGKIEGQTIKNYALTFESKNMHPTGTFVIEDATRLVTMNYNNGAKRNAWLKVGDKNWYDKTKKYVILINVVKNNSAVPLNFTMLETPFIGADFTIPLNQTGIFKSVRTVNQSLETATVLYAIRTLTEPFGVNDEVVFNAMIVEEGFENKVNSYIPFGLSSTQAVVTANGMKYSFYSNLEDKLAGKVIDLGGLEGARNTLELKEDGSGVYTQNSKASTLDGSGNWTVQTTDTVGINRFGIFIDNLKPATTAETLANVICDKHVVVTAGQTYRKTEGCSVTSVNMFYIYKDALKQLSLQDFRTYLNSNPVTIYYQLATPIVTTIPKELAPVILTQLQNQFTFGEAVAPYKVTIQAPVNKVSDLEARVAQLEKVITSTSNLSILGNYAEDEYNKEINQL